MIDAKVKVHCTDKDQYVDAHVLNYKPQKLLEVAVNTVKLSMFYKNNAYVGKMAGLEFTIKESELPKEHKEYRRS
jgi:hypothetical protein